jgi:hypothetical protein
MKKFVLWGVLLVLAGVWCWRLMSPLGVGAQETLIYVDDSAVAGGDGSRNAPFNYIEDGVDKAKQLGELNTRILVAEGDYIPKSNLVYLDSTVPQGLRIEGGYDAQTWERINNDISIRPSVIRPPNPGDSIHFLPMVGTEYVTIDGFVFTENSYNPNNIDPYYPPSSLFVMTSRHITIKNSIFQNRAYINITEFGATYDVEIENNTFVGGFVQIWIDTVPATANIRIKDNLFYEIKGSNENAIESINANAQVSAINNDIFGWTDSGENAYFKVTPGAGAMAVDPNFVRFTDNGDMGDDDLHPQNQQLKNADSDGSYVGALPVVAEQDWPKIIAQGPQEYETGVPADTIITFEVDSGQAVGSLVTLEVKKEDVQVVVNGIPIAFNFLGYPMCSDITGDPYFCFYRVQPTRAFDLGSKVDINITARIMSQLGTQENSHSYSFFVTEGTRIDPKTLFVKYGTSDFEADKNEDGKVNVIDLARLVGEML